MNKIYQCETKNYKYPPNNKPRHVKYGTFLFSASYLFSNMKYETIKKKQKMFVENLFRQSNKKKLTKTKPGTLISVNLNTQGLVIGEKYVCAQKLDTQQLEYRVEILI